MGFRDLDLVERRRLVNQGAAHFVRHVGRLSDDDLDAPCWLDGWARRQLVAQLGYNAAGLCRLLDGAVPGVVADMYASAGQRVHDIDEAVHLDAAELHELLGGQAARLDRTWHQLPPSAWTLTVRTPQGEAVEVTETLWMRNREIWIHAVDLDSGATFDAIPAVIQEALFDEIIEGWRASGVSVEVCDSSAEPIALSIKDEMAGVGSYSVQGPLPAVLQWMTGRGPARLVGADVPNPSEMAMKRTRVAHGQALFHLSVPAPLFCACTPDFV